MRLLFDENLSHRLVHTLADEYPGSTHVGEVGLRGAEDRQVWDYARSEGLIVVSEDTDFRELSFLEGFPPKIIWLDVGNAGTSVVAVLLRRERDRIERFEQQQRESILVLSLGAGTV